MGPPKGPWVGVGGGAMRKHVPAERTNELKHVPAKLGESKLGSTATTRRVKQSIILGFGQETSEIVKIALPCKRQLNFQGSGALEIELFL